MHYKSSTTTLPCSSLPPPPPPPPPTARTWASPPSNSYLGTASVPLPPAAPSPASITDSLDAVESSVDEEEGGLLNTYPAFGVGSTQGASEVHLRRLDCDEYVHTRTVAVITIDAPAAEVWGVLTDYEKLPEFVPNLAVSQRLENPQGVSDKLVVLRQV